MKKPVTLPWNLIKTAMKEFSRDLGPMMAAAISFYAILSLLPMLLLGVSISAFILGSSEQAFNEVVSYFRSYVPTQAGFIEDVLRNLVEARGVIGIIGLMILLWTGSQIFVTIETAMNSVWNVESRRSFWKSRLLALGMIFLIGILFLMSIAASFGLSLIKGLDIPLTGIEPGDISYLFNVLAFLLSFAVSTAMYYFIYKLSPHTYIRWQSALIGAVAASLLWELAKSLYESYLNHFADFSATYGSLGSVIVLILWIYYSSMIMVFCAELAQAHQQALDEDSDS